MIKFYDNGQCITHNKFDCPDCHELARLARGEPQTSRQNFSSIPPIKVPGLEPNMPTVTNEQGGTQSDTPYGLIYVPPLAILAESRVLKTGKEKYGFENWTKIPIEDHINHILQHCFAYLAGDRSDNHLANISCRAHFALELQERALLAALADIKKAEDDIPF